MKKTILAAILASSALFATTTTASASCGIECWLSNTFSSRDWIGEALQDAFGPVHNNGGEGTSKGTMASLKMADEVAAHWKPGKEFVSQEDTKEMKLVCKLDKILAVVNKTHSPEATLKACFK